MTEGWTDKHSSHLSAAERKERWCVLPPRALVERLLEPSPAGAAQGPLRIIDPACGAGAFLTWQRRVAEQADRSRLNESRACAERACGARDPGGGTLWAPRCSRGSTARSSCGSAARPTAAPHLLQSKAAWATACAWMPPHLSLPKGTSLQEDFVFFLLKASLRLLWRPGALAFITSATLLDTFAYAPVRKRCSRMRLRG